MTYHYHEATCPHCGKVHRRSCSLNNCTTATVSLEPFTASDGYEAELAICYAVTRGANFYIDFGDRPAQPSPAPALSQIIKEETMPRKENLHKLSNETGAEFDGGDIILYDTHAYSAKRITVITSEEMRGLLTLYTDGCCPVCLEEIAQGDIVCNNCLEDARTARWLGPC